MIDNEPIIRLVLEKEKMTDEDQLRLSKYKTKISKKLCGLLRHYPERAHLSMDEYGYVEAEELVRKYKGSKKDMILTMPMLMEIVRLDEKTRYGLKMVGDRLLIRCNQGHSIEGLILNYQTALPPDILYHGSRTTRLNAIMAEGLKPMKRHYVHLSKDRETAAKVAVRYREGSPCLLKVDARVMKEDGCIFYLSDNDVWLCDHVAPKYLLPLKLS